MGAGNLPLGLTVVAYARARGGVCVLVSGSLRCCVRWTELVAVVLLCCCSCVRRRGRLAELGGGWCVLVRAPGLADDSVREVRLAQVIVAVAVRLCEACRRPFWVGLVWGYGVGVKGAEIGYGGFLWGCQPG